MGSTDLLFHMLIQAFASYRLGYSFIDDIFCVLLFFTRGAFPRALWVLFSGL
jgi:hypothetical protein